MDKRTVAVRTLAVVALVFTALAAVGWVVFLGGFIYLTANKPDLGQIRRTILSPISTCNAIIGDMRLDRSVITGPCWDPYWVVSVLSPILFIVLNVKAILLIFRNELFWKFFIIHILAVITFIITVILLCFLGHLLVQMRLFIQGISYYNANLFVENPADPRYINAVFAGVLLETIFLAAGWICHILAFLIGEMESKKE